MFVKGDYMVLLAALISFLFSISLWFGIGMPANKNAGIFVGIWVPSIIATGIYVRLVARSKQMSDWVVFAVGTFSFVLCAGGLIWTVLEVRRCEREQTRQASRARPQTLSAVSSHLFPLHAIPIINDSLDIIHLTQIIDRGPKQMCSIIIPNWH